MKFKPRVYQDIMISQILERERVALWAGMGMGKTTSAMTAVSLLQTAEPGPALVLAPKRVAVSTWPNEGKKWDHLNYMRITPVIGDASKRMHALFGRPSDIYTMNYENLPWLLETLAKAGKGWPFKTVVADEATKLKGFRLQQGGKRAQALGKVAFSKVKRFVELTGTPSPNGLVDLWGQAWFLDRGQRLGRTFGAFKDRWFRSINMDAGFTKLEPREFAQEQITAALEDLCFALDPKDYFDLKDPLVVPVKVQLPANVRALYNELEEEMWAQFEEIEIEAVNSGALTNKCLQLASGAIYTDAKGNWKPVHDEKLDALESIVEEAAGMPILVAYHFKSDRARILKRFPKARILDSNPATIDEWNAGKIPMLLFHPASAGHGLNLQDGGCIIVFFSHWWDLEQYLQAVERIGPVRQMQSGHDRLVYVYHIVAEDTVDELVCDRRITKRSVQDTLMEARKWRH